MGFFKLGRLEKGKSQDGMPRQADRKEGEPLLDATQADAQHKKREPEGMSAAKPVAESRSGAATRVQAGLSVNDFISKTKNQQRQGLKPSGPELIAYARYLGIDPVADHDLLWIAVEALEAPLPSDWTEHFDSSDRVFYYNASTRVSSWTHPLEHVYRETYKTIVNLRNSNMSAQERGDALSKLQAEVRQMDQETQKEVAKWSEHQDEQGNRFYFNKEERQSTWTDPRPAKCQVLYLKMKAFRILSSTAGTPGFVDPSKDSTGSRYGSMFGSDYTETPIKSRTEKKPSSASDEVIDLSKDGPEERNSPRTSEHSAHGSDSDSDDRKKKKKKKKDKKEKKSKKGKDEKLTQLTSSQSELPGARPPAAASSSSATVPASNSDDNSGFGEHNEGKTGKGHVKVKAGIRLEPLGSLNQGSPGSSPMDRLDVRAGGLRSIP
ncbi:Cep164 [Symbiodinium natans]|uniref:Cep164 protein n=1 Tax=Symbiodinium natans TaxID=878477 RepID=A0A812M9J0_9DINO|nr:Cep164 [Symbiodinium natans]